MSENQRVQDSLKSWAAWLRKCKLVRVALLVLHLVDMWDFIGEQLVWAFMPFLNQSTRMILTELVEHPESLHQLQALLAEGDD